MAQDPILEAAVPVCMAPLPKTKTHIFNRTDCTDLLESATRSEEQVQSSRQFK